VEHVHATRVIKAATRRGPFQEKIGAGMTVEHFESLLATGTMGRVGLPESVGTVWDTLGRDLGGSELSFRSGSVGRFVLSALVSPSPLALPEFAFCFPR